MIFTLTFKTPDVVDDTLANIQLNEDEFDELQELCSKWVEYGEYLRVEIDSDKKTCRVLECK